jgi:hypothetical protein
VKTKGWYKTIAASGSAKWERAAERPLRATRQSLEKASPVEAGSILAAMAIASLCLFSTAAAGAGRSTGDLITVLDCPGQGGAPEPLPVRFSIDCSHIADPEKKRFCRPFIENVACRAFKAYRKITGIKLETRCPLLTYTIYENRDWPHKGVGAGGMSYKCQVNYLAQYSILRRSDLGPYDVHEILHHYHFGLPPLPNQHSLFEPAMLEAMREIGDQRGYNQALERAKASLTWILGKEQGKVPPLPQVSCYAAQTAMETSLYVEQSKSVYRFYRELDRRPLDANVRLGKLLFETSGRKADVANFLSGHGCPKAGG